MSDHKTYAYFYVKGFNCDPEEISNILGFEPTEVGKKGEKWGPNEIREREESYWRFKSSESTSDYHSNIHFENLLEKLEKHKNVLVNLPGEANIGITYVSTCYYPNIAVILERSLLERVVNLGLSLEYDIYSLTDEK